MTTQAAQVGQAQLRHRVVSLLPSATEILCSIPGGAALLAGRSHECDFPVAETALVPIVVRPSAQAPTHYTATSSKEVDAKVRNFVRESRPLFALDKDALVRIQPTVILTSNLCSVCSLTEKDVCSALEALQTELPEPPVVVLHDPMTLRDVLDSYVTIGRAVGLEEPARACRGELLRRIQALEATAPRGPPHRSRVLFLEWLEPQFVGGHWTPELIVAAGGDPVLNAEARPSFTVEPPAIVEADPDLIVVAPCGYTLGETQAAVRRELDHQAWWRNLRAVRAGNVVLVDGSAHFNRPGPRLVDALEWMAWVMRATPARLREGTDIFPAVEWAAHVLSPETTGAGAEPAADTSAETAPKQPRTREAAPPRLPPDIEEIHAAACARGENHYTDPRTGLLVFTELASVNRGVCCGRGCRHCAYGHFNVKAGTRTATATPEIKRPTFLRYGPGAKEKKPSLQQASTPELTVLFFSGGKDSYLAWRRLQHPVVLLTTVQGDEVPEQRITLKEIFNAARALRSDLMVVPLSAQHVPNDEYLRAVTAALDDLARRFQITDRARMRLVFGDLHLADIRAWREAQFMGAGFPRIEFPLWGVPNDELFLELDTDPSVSRVVISNTTLPELRHLEGQRFNRAMFESLKASGHVDPFGEKGEFHTRVDFAVGES